MPALYEITGAMLPVIQQYQQAESQEELDALAKSLQDLELSFQEKALAIGHFCINEQSDIDAIENEIKRLKAMSTRKENHIEWMKNYLKNHMEATGQLRIDSATVGVAIRKNPPSIIIEDVTKIPEKYMRIIPEKKEPDKVLIKQAFKDGIGIDGCKMEQGTRLEIK